MQRIGKGKEMNRRDFKKKKQRERKKRKGERKKTK